MITKRMIEDFNNNRGHKIRIAVAGAGYMAKGLFNQISLTQDIQVVAIASRTKSKAQALVDHHDMMDTQVLDSVGEIPMQEVDIVMDLTGDVEVGARLAYDAINYGRHIITSAETDSTVGPVLAEMARKAGVIYSNMWGDEPGLIKGLYDYAELLGFEITVLGKFKGFQDCYATPDSVLPWAEKSGQNPTVISSFADGTKLAMEMTVLSNATGFTPDVRGMHLRHSTFEEVLPLLRLEEEGGILSRKGVIEVVVGPKPGGAVFAIVRTDNEEILSSLQYYKMGDGPHYMLYYPYHMPGIEMIFGIYEMMLLGKSSIEPIGAPVSDVITMAKKDLKPGDVLGPLGSFEYAGMIEEAQKARAIDALPAGLAKDAVMLRPVAKGHIITLSDVEIRNHDLCQKLRAAYREMVIL